jgi:transcriptional regulator with XRE-family HTH domain
VDLTSAVRKLRGSVGESQQAFATRLGISIRALANYEKDRQPSGRALASLAKAAESAGEKDLIAVFENALLQELGRGVPMSVIDDLQIKLLRAEVTACELNSFAQNAKQRGILRSLNAQLSEIQRVLKQANPLSRDDSEESK